MIEKLTQACIYVCMAICVYVFMNVCIYVCIYVCMYMRMHLCMYVSVCTITCRFYTPLKIPFLFNINIQGRVRARQVYN